jgi:hypothetical protein
MLSPAPMALNVSSFGGWQKNRSVGGQTDRAL